MGPADDVQDSYCRLAEYMVLRMPWEVVLETCWPWAMAYRCCHAALLHVMRCSLPTWGNP